MAELAAQAFRHMSRLAYQKRCLLILERALDVKQDQEVLDITMKPESATVRKIHTRKEAEKAVRAFTPEKLKLFLKRMKNPALHYYVAEAPDGSIHGHCWVAYNDYYDPALGVTIPLQPHQAYFFDGYIAPEHRAGMLPLQLIAPLMLDAAWSGKTTSLALSDVTNKRSLLYHYANHYKETMWRIVITKLFGKVVATRVEAYTEPLLTRKNLMRKK